MINKSRVAPDGERELVPKDDGQGLMNLHFNQGGLDSAWK
jgi:hypothetical protein